MRNEHKISVIIPAVDEENSIAKVVNATPEWVDQIIVVDNGSQDRTAARASEAGATVIPEPVPGYGNACLRGIANLDNPDIVVFVDGDFSDYPEDMHLLVDPIVADSSDMVIGSRVRGDAEPGALTPQQVFGNTLACFLINLFWRVKFTDLGPFRAIRFSTLKMLQMRDRDFGWTVEMQIKAAQQKVRSTEVPVRYRKRIGISKISGTLRGVIAAGTKILYVIFTSAWQWHFAPKGQKAGVQARSAAERR